MRHGHLAGELSAVDRLDQLREARLRWRDSSRFEPASQLGIDLMGRLTGVRGIYFSRYGANALVSVLLQLLKALRLTYKLQKSIRVEAQRHITSMLSDPAPRATYRQIN